MSRVRIVRRGVKCLRALASCAASLVALSLAVRSTRASGLSAGERQMAASIDQGIPEGLALLERAVNINSGTLNLDGVRAVGAMFRAELDALGFATRWVDGTAWQHAGHLLALRRGRPGSPRVLLIGHLDTVFERDSPFQRFERLDESTARGPGVTDMKGGDVVMLMALRALHDAGRLDRLDLTVVLSGDEERAGSPRSLARRDLVAAADYADIALGFEDGDGDPRTAVISRRGAEEWTLRTSGRPGHSSQIFRDGFGSGAVFEAARILTAFHDSLGHEGTLTLNPALVLGGTRAQLGPSGVSGTAAGKTNVIAESCLVVGDLRTLTSEQRAAARATLRDIVQRHLPLTNAEIVFDDGYPPLAPSEGNRRLLALYDEASRAVGAGPVTAVDPRLAGAADISFAAGRVDMALDGIGLMGSGGHTVEETADLRTLASQAKRAAVLLSRLSEGR